MVKVSVLTPIYADTPAKVEWLLECARSVQAQSIEAEHVVVDDESPLDVTAVERMGSRLVRASHRQGPARCRNTAAALARAGAVIALDADDWFADTEVLADLYDTWLKDQARFVYGDMELVDGNKRERIKFPDFGMGVNGGILDLSGIVPVTALHSIECHNKAGGWKAEFQFGLEDVEYWIAAAAAGFCGYKMDRLVFNYRKHDASRTKAMRSAGQMGAERALIRQLHSDIFQGRWPMGCCGGRGSSSGSNRRYGPAPATMTPAPVPFRDDEVIWVKYLGNRQGRFGMVGPRTRHTYFIDGIDSVFKIHVDDAQLFRRSGRGQHFAVGVAPPEMKPAPVLEPEPEKGYEPEPPPMAEIIQFDRIGAEERGIPFEEVRHEPPPLVVEEIEEIRYTDGTPVRPDDGLEELGRAIARTPPDLSFLDQEPSGLPGPRPLDALDLANVLSANVDALDIQQTLEMESWTVGMVAAAEVADLTPYPGIGPANAKRMIEKAKTLVG